MGYAGYQGDTGEMGPMGPKGSAGTDGETGTPGPTGEKGSLVSKIIVLHSFSPFAVFFFFSCIVFYLLISLELVTGMRHKRKVMCSDKQKLNVRQLHDRL